MKKILIPLPSYGFDPTETAIPFKIISNKNIDITFITPDGKQAAADKIMLTGKGLGIWKNVLKARKDAVEAYYEMEKDKRFRFPIKYDEVKESDFDGILLPGGHDKGVKEYLESEYLQTLIADFFKSEKKVAAVCHGVLLVSRSKNAETGKSVIYDYKTTSLLKSQELIAYYLTKRKLKDYYLTYPEITVEEAVISVLSDKSNFIKGQFPVSRDSFEKLNKGFAVKDRNYLSARWPGDAYRFASEFVKML